jgi:NMD protein affecting ribosome stability and mRNA decay
VDNYRLKVEGLKAVGECRCVVCGRRISQEEFEGFEGMCEDCYVEYFQQVEDDEEYYP